MHPITSQPALHEYQAVKRLPVKEENWSNDETNPIPQENICDESVPALSSRPGDAEANGHSGAGNTDICRSMNTVDREAMPSGRNSRMLTNLADYNKRGAKEGIAVDQNPLQSEMPAGIRRSGRAKHQVKRYDASCGT